MTRVCRRPSCGTVVLPNSRPSRVTALASGPRPATENDEAVESVPPSGSTPATRPTSDARSLGSTGQLGQLIGSERALHRAGRRRLAAAQGLLAGDVDPLERDGASSQLDVPGEAVFVGVPLDERDARRHAEHPHGHPVLSATVGEEDGEAAARVGARPARDLRFQRVGLDLRVRDRRAVFGRDDAGDDVGALADLGGGARRRQGPEGPEQEDGQQAEARHGRHHVGWRVGYL